MKKTCLILSLVVVAGSIASFSSPRAIHPLKGVQTVKLDIMIGGTLGLGDDIGLFGTDFDRAEHFKNELRSAIKTKLHEYGIDVSEQAKDEMAFDFRGRFIKNPRCADDCIFMFELYIINANFEQRCEDNCFIPAMGTYIGVSSDEALEETLMNYAITVLNDSLSRIKTSG